MCVKEIQKLYIISKSHRYKTLHFTFLKHSIVYKRDFMYFPDMQGDVILKKKSDSGNVYEF